MRNSAMIATIATATNAVDYATVTPDDFTKVNGIGEVREQELYKLGRLTYTELIAADPDKLADKFSSRMVTPTMVAGWQAQATALLEG